MGTVAKVAMQVVTAVTVVTVATAAMSVVTAVMRPRAAVAATSDGVEQSIADCASTVIVHRRAMHVWRDRFLWHRGSRDTEDPEAQILPGALSLPS